MEKYIIGAMIAFFIIAIWEYLAHKKRNEQLAIFIIGLFGEISEMAESMGYEDVFDYLTKRKGEQYATIAGINIMSTLKTLNVSDLGKLRPLIDKHRARLKL